MKRVLTGFVFAAAVVAITLACSRQGRADAGAPAAPAQQLWHEAATATPPAQPPVQPFPSLAPLIKQLKPAVVNISTSTVVKNHPRTAPAPRNPGMPEGPWGDFFERYFGQPREMPEFRSNALGSGFIINRDGYVLTNNHVVGDATEIKVRLADGREFSAKVVGKDPPTDVALVRLEKAPTDLPTVPLGDSDALEQGDFVLALGNPLGLRESASFGIVSAKDRTINAGPFDDFIQTDAAINPGNSGGPLFNMRGEVIGINTAIVSPQIGQGIGFAVPINLAKQSLPQLEKGGKVARGYLGVTVRELTPDLAQGFGLAASTKGALIEQVVPKTPAAKAGLKVGDVVVAVNGKPVEVPGQLTRAVAAVSPGNKVTVTVLRDSKKEDFVLTVAKRPDEEMLARGEAPEEGEGGAAATEAKGPKLGLRLQALTPDMARELKFDGEGVLVADVSADGPAAAAGLQRGDVILEVNRQAVSKPDQVAKLVAKAKPGDVVLLRVRRGANATFVPIRLPEAEAPAPEKK
ncbi:MAG TPA: DegQ family serine endoprotease [Anaeromyxobacteraceae bacterium]|nr:DegQ family serine endoprotease [Anaeromyxobacteraceae bacterium]